MANHFFIGRATSRIRIGGNFGAGYPYVVIEGLFVSLKGIHEW